MARTDPHLQLGRYQLYKEGTRRIVQWLTQKASRFINISPFLTADKTQTGSRTIKARALVSLAEAIATAQSTHDSPQIVPLDIATMVKIVREVIDGRQASAQWYAAQPASAEAEKPNETHKFFINVLRDVQRILESIKLPEKSEPAKDRPKAKKPASKNLENDLSNLFLQLELEEPSESPLGNHPPSHSVSSTPRRSSPDVILDTGDEKADEAFALWCNLEDMRDVRRYLQDIWQGYSTGEISLMTATMVTETAFGLMRIADERFVQKFPAFKDQTHIASFLSSQRAVTGKGKTTSFASSSSGSIPPTRPTELVDLIHMAFCNLQDIAVQVKEILAKDSAGMPLEFQPNVTPECYDFNSILRVNIVELASYVRFSREEPVHLPPHQARQSQSRPEFIKGIIDYIDDDNDGRIPLWLACAYQMYSDIYVVIGSDPWCASEEYVTKMGQLKVQVSAFRPWRPQVQKTKHGIWTAVDDRMRDFEFNQPMMRISKETIKLLGQHLLNTNNINAFLLPDLGKPLSSLTGMPCAAGKLLHHAKVLVHHASVDSMNREVVILAMAHLYTTARRYGLVSIWHDMEHVISQQNKSIRPLVMKPNKNGDAFAPLRQYLLCLGAPATEFARGRTPKLPKDIDIAGKCRLVTVTSAYMNALYEGQSTSNRLGFSRGDLIEHILNHLTSIADAELPEGKHSKFTTQHNLQQLLSTYKSELIKDEPYLNFNYLALWISCRDILSNVARSLNMIDQPWVIVYLLLHDAATATLNSNSPKDSKLGEAARLMEDVIAARGNKFSVDAFNQSSGRIPKSLRPVLVCRSHP